MLTVDGEEVDVVECRSPLEIREHLCGRRENDRPLVLITGLPESELGGDILARLAKRRLHDVNAWTIVMDLFQARRIDPRLIMESWLAAALLECAPPNGYPPVPSGVLDRNAAWRVLLTNRLGIDSSNPPDAVTLLRWAMDRGNVGRYSAAPKELRDGLRVWLAETAGGVEMAILDGLDDGHGSDALPVGLACAVVFRSDSSDEMALGQARVRLERYYGSHPIPTDVGRRWAAAAEEVLAGVLLQDGVPAARAWAERADAILNEIGAGAFAHLSNVSLAGLEQRLGAYARGLRQALTDEKSDTTPQLLSAVGAIRAHRMAGHLGERVPRTEMALRLVRWLRTARSQTVPGSLAEAAGRYAGEGAFVDWALSAPWW